MAPDTEVFPQVTSRIDASGNALQCGSCTKCVTNAAAKPHLRGCRSRMLATPDRTQPAVPTYFFLENIVQRATLPPPPALLQLLGWGPPSPKAAQQQAVPTRMGPHQQRLPTQRPPRRWARQAATAGGVTVARGTRNDRRDATKTVSHRRSTTVPATVVHATQATHRHAALPHAASTRSSATPSGHREKTTTPSSSPPPNSPIRPSAPHSRHRHPPRPVRLTPHPQPCTCRHARHSVAGWAVPAANAAHVSVYTPVQAGTGQPLPCDRCQEIIVVNHAGEAQGPRTASPAHGSDERACLCYLVVKNLKYRSTRVGEYVFVPLRLDNEHTA